MMNWIAAYLIAFLTKLPQNYDGQSKMVSSNLGGFAIPQISEDYNIGIILALILVVVMFIIFAYSTFGFKNKAIGLSKSSSEYMHYNLKNNYLYAMLISGALAGFAGLTIYAAISNGSPVASFTASAAVSSFGFDGIAVALLGNNNPLGILLSALLISILQVGGGNIRNYAAFDSSTGDLVVSIIIWIAAITNIVPALISYIRKKRSI